MYFVFRTLKESYKPLIKEILKQPTIIDENGSKVKELLNVYIKIKNPNINSLPNEYFNILKNDFVEEYKNSLLYGSNNDDKFVYTYHKRLFKYNNINQIEYIIDKLNENPNSRRAIAITWQPEVDTKNKDVPCLQYLNFQKRYNNDTKRYELYQMVLFRSNDLLIAYPSNVYALIELGKYIANETNSYLKEYNHFVNNLHIYVDRDRTEILKLWR